MLGILSLLFNFIATFYYQWPTFILSLGAKWFYQAAMKRNMIRIIAIIFYILFIIFNPALSSLIYISIIHIILFTFSFINAPQQVFIALNENNMLKQSETNNRYDQTEIIGVYTTHGNGICYPLEDMVQPRHIINDIMEDQPLLVTYCMACRSAMIYNPMINQRRLTFDVCGVHRRNMIMRDRETGTIWQQATGLALYGPLAQTILTPMPYQITSFSAWKTAFPNSYISVEKPNDIRGVFSVSKLKKMLKITDTLTPPGITPLHGLNPHEMILGICINQTYKAYPLKKIHQLENIYDRPGDTEIIISFHQEKQWITITRSNDKANIPFQIHAWMGWKEFHPDTLIWNENDE